MHALRALTLVAFAACGPSKEERARVEARLAELDREAEARQAKETEVVAKLEQLAKTLATTCAAEFLRASHERLGPGAATPCELGTDPELLYYDPGSASAWPELARSMSRTCAELQKELDLAVRRAGPDNPSSARAIDAEYALKKFERTWVVGVVYQKHVRPMVNKDSLGNPVSFRPGLVKGDAYLYRVSTGKLECAAKVEAKSSDTVRYFKNSDQLGDEGTSGLDVTNDLEAQVVRAVVAAPKLSLEAAASPVAKAGKPTKAAKTPAKRRKSRR